ncbi:SseB protein N-terminal domain-containing protein [Micromonospora coriariae]|uniref:SseB protein N-terminal domain-containing protein n=1 Tax=Micromonospora coriariae TaxID=285665 RepID=A0A1C4XZ63_9ACTN|nr:SseB family protein [Micromonospora coriariae]SCF13763.1 SseB protein N-terminal domain-containing protein [Micromonospora coriariae]
MTSPSWPEIVARLRDAIARCDRDTDLELSAGSRGIRLLVRREVVRVLCPGYDEARLTALGWRRPTGDTNWWYELPRVPQQVERLSTLVARTAAEVLTDQPGALSCRAVAPATRPTPAARPAGPVVRAAPGQTAEPAVVALLAAAAERHDLPGYLGVLAGAMVCVPLTGEPAADGDFPWAVVGDATGAPLLPVFTSPQALAAFAGAGVPFVALPCAELLEDWPDESWGLAVDAGSDRAVSLAPPALAALLTANVPAG